MITLEKGHPADFGEAARCEWLETNGIGGYAMSTVAGANTRRYHGLLNAATRPPLGRVVLLAKFEESVMVDGEEFELSTNQYPRTIHPHGYRHITRFRLDPFPIWTYEIGTVVIEKRVFMVHGENSTVCTWLVVEGDAGEISLTLRPLVAFRDHHHLNASPPKGRYDVAFEDGRVSIERGDLYLNLFHTAAEVNEVGSWYHDFEYALEMERGFDFVENLFSPCSLSFDLSTTATVIASTEIRRVGDVDHLEKEEMKRRAKVVATARTKTDIERRLVLAADQFIVDRGEGKTVIAGYPWFSDWGRDTMIALPGLTLATNRPDVAKGILAEFALHLSEGMIPNRFPDEGEQPDYNTVDATLWFFEAVRAYAEKTEDFAFVRELYPKLTQIIDAHVAGTHYNIHVDTDGLLFAGDGTQNLTWMDAKIGEWVVTPRTGKAVEIQALWYNALLIAASFAEHFEDAGRAGQFRSMAATARDSFNGQFWNADEECLLDVVSGEERDASVRPNQIFAASLHYTMLDQARARKVVERVATDLLTPVGLRSLSPRDSRYRATYSGSPLERDSSYHQGTIWAWLIGPYVTAYRRVHARDKKADNYVAELIAGLESHLSESCLGQVSEIFDAEAPHTPRGAPAQAWSVGEILRVIKSGAD